MMSQKAKYLECKRRNEQQLLNIRDLETKIAHVQAQIDSKKNAVNELKRKQTHYDNIKQALSQKYPTSNESITASPSMSNGGRRDLTQLLSTTPEIICRKLEVYIKRQFERQTYISSAETAQIKHLVNRLPEDLHKQLANQMVDTLLRQVADVQINQAKYQYKIQDTPEYKKIENHVLAQREKVHHLTKRKEDLQMRTNEAEAKAVRRIRELYADPVIQSAVTKHIRVKAVNQQLLAESQSLLAVADTLAKTIKSSKESEGPLHKEALMKDIETKTTSIAERLKSILHANEIGNNAIRDDRVKIKDENRETIEQLLDDIKKEKVRLQLERLNMYRTGLSKGMDTSVADNDAAVITNALSPLSAISITKAYEETKNLVESVDYFSKNTVEKAIAGVRETLGALVKEWEASLEKYNIPILQNIPEDHDGIDNVIQCVDTLRDHVERTEQQHLQEQKDIIKDKMNMTEEVNKEMKIVKSLINERETITNVGSEYEIQSKNFKEWLDQLQVKKTL